MATYDQALVAKDKFKELYWKKSPDRFNVIGIGIESFFTIDINDIDLNEFNETDIVDHCYVKAYLFDIDDIVALELPDKIDDVEVRYIPVVADI